MKMTMDINYTTGIATLTKSNGLFNFTHVRYIGTHAERRAMRKSLGIKSKHVWGLVE
jgi:hypothetical protein